MQPVTVAAVATRNWINQPERSLENIRRWACKARAQGAELILFPELSITGYLTHPVVREGAQSIPGPATDRLVEIAAEVGAVLCAGLLEREGETFYNTQVLVGPHGFIGKQRKLHIPDLEMPYWQGGDRIQTFDIGKARVGISICRDTFFSEMLRTLYFQGAALLLMPFGYNTMPRSRYLEEHIHGVVMRGECWSNGFFGLFCNSAGKRAPSEIEPNGRAFPGWAGVLNPFGEPLAYTRQNGSGEALVISALDPEPQHTRRGQYNLIARSLRPELYLQEPET